MGRARTRPEFGVACTKCGAEADEPCVSTSVGAKMANFHRARQIEAGTVGPNAPLKHRLPEHSPRRKPCPRCGAEAMQPCLSLSTGKPQPNYHAARLEKRTVPVPSCPRPVVSCWIKECKNDPTDCEFCGVCADPDCELEHSRLSPRSFASNKDDDVAV